MIRNRRDCVAFSVAAMVLLVVVAALGLSAIQTALAEAVVDSPSFVTSNGKIYPIREPADSYRDADWMELRYPIAIRDKVPVIVHVDAGESAVNSGAMASLIEGALLKSGAFEIVAAARAGAKHPSRAHFEVQARIVEYAMVKKSGGFGASLVGSVVGSAVGNHVGISTTPILGSVAERAVDRGIDGASRSGKGDQAEIQIELAMVDRESGRVVRTGTIAASSKAKAIPAAAIAAGVHDAADWKGPAFATAAHVAANKAGYRAWMWVNGGVAK